MIDNQETPEQARERVLYNTPVFTLNEILKWFSLMAKAFPEMEKRDMLTADNIGGMMRIRIFEENPILKDWVNRTGVFECEENGEDGDSE